ncbi:MAG: hypothetical protein IPK12_01275 [Gemmatimonadetes bacterium]|nr:hypothetical protein [Gemmatimonadota bacterium]
MVLRKIVEVTGEGALPNVLVEKLLVLFVRIGVRKQILNPWSGRIGGEGVVGVRYSLHGAVLNVVAPKPTSYQDSGKVSVAGRSLFRFVPGVGVAKLLRKEGVLHKSKGVPGYQVLKVPEAPLGATAEGFARRFGAVFGMALKKSGNDQMLTVDDLTYVASCSLPGEVACALAAEVDIVQRGYEVTINRIVATLERGSGLLTVPRPCARVTCSRP